MTSVARGRGERRAPTNVPRLPVLPGVSAPLPAAVEEHRRRALGVALDVMRISLSVLFLRVAQCLTLHPRHCTLAALEGELRETLLALGATLLTELVRLRGTGDLGPTYTCSCGVRLVRKELAVLQQRTWFGTITLERAVYAGAACHVRAHHVPLDAAWGLLGTDASAATADGVTVVALPDPDGGTLAPVAPGTGPARLAPAFAAVVVEFPPREDEMVKSLLSGKGPGANPDYDLDNFERLLAESFTVERREQLEPGGRVLYLATPSS